MIVLVQGLMVLYTSIEQEFDSGDMALRTSMTLLEISVLGESLSTLSMAPLLSMSTNCLPLFMAYASAIRESLPTKFELVPDHNQQVGCLRRQYQWQQAHVS